MGLTTISYSESAKNDIYVQLSNLIGNDIKIRSLCLSELRHLAPIKDDLILISAANYMNSIIPYLDANCKYINATRTINPQKIKFLLDIPSGSEVLVVNDQYESAKVLVKELNEIGLNLKFCAYNPVQDLEKNFKYAITPGYPQYIPE